MTETPSLEDRVAALEARLAPGPLLKPFGLPPLTEEQEAELRREFDETMPAFATHRVIQQPPPLTPEQVRQFLRECVTVVKPGETLVIRVPWTTTPGQLRELQDAVDQAAGWLDLPFKTLILPGDQLAVAEPEETPGPEEEIR